MQKRAHVENVIYLAAHVIVNDVEHPPQGASNIPEKTFCIALAYHKGKTSVKKNCFKLEFPG